MTPVPRGRSSLFALCLAFGLCVAAIFWITEGIAPWVDSGQKVWRHYEYLAEGFAHGHTYLSKEPPPELLGQKDPYDPVANLPTRLLDASLYHGKYYLYYGPTPALALMTPWRLLTGRMLAQRSALALLAAAGLAGLGLLLWDVRRRYFPGLSPATLGLILVTAFHISWLPVVLRRPGVWEVPIVSAVACLWWAIYFLWKFHDSGGKARWAAATGVALALLMGSRATFVFAAGVIAALAILPASGSPLRLSSIRKSGLPALALAFAGGIALLVYNHERFGRWLEFGQSFQLWGADERNVAHFSLSYAPFNLRTYFLSLPEFSPYFPFLYPAWTGDLPKGYIALEEVYGILFMMPVLVVGIAALTWAWQSTEARPGRVLIGATTAASALSAACLVCWAGACSRYVAELLAGWTIVTSVGLMVIFGSTGPRRPGRLVRILATAASVWTIVCVWLASAEFRGFMKLTSPRAYAALAHTLEYPSEWWIRSHDIRFGPVEVTVRVAPSTTPNETVLIASGFPNRINQLILLQPDPEHVQLALTSNSLTVLETPALPARGELRFRLSAPWLYPPEYHPYWDTVGDSPKRTKLQTQYSLQIGSDNFEVLSIQQFDPSSFGPAVLNESAAGPGGSFVKSIGLATKDR